MEINFYGLLIGIGMLIGLEAAEMTRKRVYLDLRTSLYDMLPVVMISSFVLARGYHVWHYWQYYRLFPQEIFFIWQGGMGIWGAVFGGILGIRLFFLFSGKKLPGKKFLQYLDLAVLGLALGQVIGRWGNYFNQELYGLPTKLPWAIFIKPENRLAGWQNFEHFHPLFLYESFGCLVIFLILLSLVRKCYILKIRAKAGLLFFLYLGLYSLVRFFLEFLRLETWQVSGFRVNQVVSAGLFLVSGAWFIRNYKHFFTKSK